MNTVIPILLCIGIPALVVWLLYTFKRRAYVNNIIQKYPSQVQALCRLGDVDLDINHITPTAKKKIVSFNPDYWEDWLIKVDGLISFSLKYSDVMSEYIICYFPYVKETPAYCNHELFGSKDTLCHTLINCLLYDDVLKLNQLCSDDWAKRDVILKKAETIELSNPDAIRVLRKEDPNLTINDIVNLQKRIEQIQHQFAVAAAFDAWLPTQKEFNSLVRNLRDEHAKNCGCYTYDIEFHKPQSSGKFSSEKISVWQIFCNSFSPYLKEYQSSLSFSMLQNISELKTRQKFFINTVYDDVLPYINAIANGKKILVVFNNRTSYNWELQTYTYHYRYLKSILKNNNIAYIDFDNLPTLIDDFKFEFDIVCVFDFITINSDLIYTSKLIIETFSTKIPNIVWYSMIKEYDESEMKVLCADAIKEQELKKKEAERKLKEEQKRREIVQSKSKSIQFIKSQLLRMNKSSRFSIFAVTNTLIGSAVNASDVKKIWMSDPNKIQMTSSSESIVKKHGYIAVAYSNDRGISWHILEMQGEYDNIDDVSNFTYEFFNKVGVLADFIEKGESAINYMNSLEKPEHAGTA